MTHQDRRPSARRHEPHIAFGMVAGLILAACGAAAPLSPVSSAPSLVSSAPNGIALTPSATATASRSSGIASSAPVAARGASLVGPTGLVFDRAGNLYVSGCTWTASYIYRIDPNGMLTKFAGSGPTDFTGDGGPAKAAALQCPVGMAIGPDEALYFADHASNRVRRIDGGGIITTVAGSGPAGVDAGSFSGDGGPATKATLQEPWDVAFDRAGNLFIGDRDNYRVRRVDPNGVITTVAGTGNAAYSGDHGPAMAAGMCPQGVAVDAAGDVVFGDPCSNRIRKVDSHGIVSTIVGNGKLGFAGDGGPATAALVDRADFPTIDGAGGLVIVSGLRIRRIDAKGVITTVAGIGATGRPHDGMPALEAPFRELYGLAVDATGNVYVADGDGTVYRVDTKGILTVFAGAVQ